MSDDFIVKFRVRCPTKPFSRDTLVAFERWALQHVYAWELSCPSMTTDEPWANMRVVFDFHTGLRGDEVGREWEFEEGEDTAIYMLVHFNNRFPGPVSSDNGMCIAAEAPTPRMCPRGLALRFLRTDDAPRWIEQIGVSAVSPESMMGLWWRCVSYPEEENSEDSGEDRWGFNRGYMVHSMWVFDKTLSDGYTDIREQSFNFPWCGYDLLRADYATCMEWQ